MSINAINLGPGEGYPDREGIEVVAPELRLAWLWDGVGELIPTDSSRLYKVVAQEEGVTITLGRSLEDEPRFVEAKWKIEGYDAKEVKVQELDDLSSDESLAALNALELSMHVIQGIQRRMIVVG
jgi:hypothetical protein